MQLETSDLNTTKKILIAYFDAMHQWESQAYAQLKSKDDDLDHFDKTFEEAKIALDKIYAEFLTKKERKQTSSQYALGHPPEYDSKIEKITNCIQKNRNRIEIETLKNNVAKGQNRYVFLRKAGVWRLDHKRTWWNHLGKWELVPI